MKSICLGIVLVLGLFSCLVLVSCKAEPIPIQMKDDNVTMPQLFNEVIPDLDRSEADCENVKPDDYGYYSVNDMVMSKEDWIEYCNDIKSDRKILEQDLESRSDIPNSILRVKVWYDTTLTSHPKINGNQNKAKQFLDKAMDEAQKLFCLDSFGFRLTMKEVDREFVPKNMIPQGSIGQFENTVANGENCKDEYKSHCPGWARAGFCNRSWNNGKKVKNACRKSCNMCVDANLVFIKDCAATGSGADKKTGQKHMKTAGGWARVGGVCARGNIALSCFHKNADEVSMGVIMAHEIGHLLGARHSNLHNNCKHHGGSTSNGFMHQTSKPDNVFWSSCTRNLIKKRYNNKWCLNPDHSSTSICNSLLKVDCGNNIKAPSCHYCVDKNGNRRCNGDCEYNSKYDPQTFKVKNNIKIWTPKGRCETNNNGCLDILNSCKNYNPKSAACSHRWNGGNYAGLTVSDTCKKSCGKCGGGSSNCKDNNSACPSYARFCWHIWFKTNCKKTCNLC